MRSLQNQVKKLETQQASGYDLEEFLTDLLLCLFPDAPVPKFKDLPKMTAQEFLRTQCKVLRPKILEE